MDNWCYDGLALTDYGIDEELWLLSENTTEIRIIR